MHDDIVRTLTDVLHIPDLKKNLISLGAFDSIGYKCIIEGVVMRVTRVALVVMRRQKNENLCVVGQYNFRGNSSFIIYKY